MLALPRTVHGSFRSSILTEQRRPIAFPNVPAERSALRLTLRHLWRPWTSFRLGRVFSSLGVRLGRKSRIAALITGPAIILCALPGFAWAQSTWLGGIQNNSWNVDPNWVGGVPAPTGTATFPSVPLPNSPVTFSANTLVGTLVFNGPNYTFDFGAGSTGQDLTINGNGVNASLANAPTFNVIGAPNHSTPAMVFDGASSAGTANIVAGQVTDTNNGFNGGFIKFLANSTADQATITVRDASNLEFHDGSTAGTATLTAASGGFIFFDDTASADHASITVDSGGEMDFSPTFPGCGCTGGTATAGNATITNNGTTSFWEGSSAGNAIITSSGLIEFHDQSSAGNATFNTHFGATNFFDTSTAGNAAFTVIEGNMDFFNSSRAGTSTIIAGRPVSQNGGFDAGFIKFHDNSSADHATISSLDGSSVEFHDFSRADHATLIVGESGFLEFVDSSSGDQARVINNSGGEVKIADLATGGTSFGSIEGAGTFNLGSKQLTVGSLNTSTTVSGVIEDGFPGGGGDVGGSLVKVGTGTLTLTGVNPYTGGTTVSGGALVVGDFANPTAALSGGGPISVGPGGTLGGYGSVTGDVTNGGVIAPGSAAPGLSGSPMGAFTIKGDYAGAGGTMAINTVLGGDNSPTDKLIISGGRATGTTTVQVTNVGGGGARTVNGILVVNATDGATTAPRAFALAPGELRGGAFVYDLFRGGPLGGGNDWFLRSNFDVTPEPPVVPPVAPPETSLPDRLPDRPPLAPLPPGVYPIIGPELATYGVVQPLARQLGLSILGTLDDRRGDTYEPDGCAVQPAVATSSVDLPTRKSVGLPTRKGPTLAPCPLFSPSVWGRFFGQTIHNQYQGFADPSANGDLGGFQGGIDLLRGSLIAGQYERAGLYGAYGDVHADVDGLVTNPAATAYILNRTGSMNLNSWSAGGYWTHTGPGGWYLDAVLQGTWYYGSASTQFARLNTDGTGFIASLEGGYPFSWPQLGPGFVIEPQGQILWQKVSFRHDYDGLGDVALGDTTGPSGRIGLRTKWTIVTAGGQVWQPYLRGNLWRDWGAEVNAVYSGTDLVPVASQVTRLELGGGLTGKISANVSVFANVDYEFSVGASEGEKRSGVRGAFGAQYTW